MSAFANPLLPGSQQDLWRALNDTHHDHPGMSVAELIEDQIHAAPHRLAVMTRGRTLTYGELAGAAQRLAERLAGGPDDGTGPEPGRARAVLICVEPGWEQVVAVLAAVMANMPFHAVNPGQGSPSRWVAAGELGARAVLTQSWLTERMTWPPDLELITVDDVPTAASHSPRMSLSSASPSDVLCLLAPEPASAGLRPVVHGAVVDTLVDLSERFDLGPEDRALVVTSLGDEISLTTLLLMLGVGGTVVIPDDIDIWTPATWMTLMARDLITVWFSTPSLAALLAEHLAGRNDGLPRGLRLALIGGEPMPASLAHRLRLSATSILQVAHLGVPGPPGLWATCYEVPEDADGGHVPAGVPLQNREVYVVGESGSPCPVWVSGRILVGGRFLPAALTGQARGPDGQPLWTSQLTGRLLPTGTIEVLGENATRITVQGHPLQLREVEGTLMQHPALLAAAVVPAGDGSVAYTKSAPGSEISAAELMDHLRARMSPYLLPAAVESVGRFALTPGGRIDRDVLTDNASKTQAPVERAALTAPIPAGLLDRACALAARILDLPDVEPTMNLMDIGASSIQLVRIAVAAEDELGLMVDVDELMRFPSIAVMISASTPVSDAPADPGPEAATASPDGSLDASAAAPSEASDLRDPLQRIAFKDSKPGTRRDLGSGGVVLPGACDLSEQGEGRRTTRRFGSAPVPAAQLTSLLAVLCDLPPRHDEIHRRYPSAGSLFPMQAYVAVRRDRVDGLSAGTYYVQPETRRLIPIERGWEVPPSAHGWINREAAATSAFSLHLVAHLPAITPMYGELARDYSIFEAGSMAQVLMTSAADLALGLCPVGAMEASVLTEPLRLGPADELIHTLLGGVLPGPGEQLDAAERTADMMRRIGDAALDSLDWPGR